ncbi:MAG: YicC/YloC family endoribonuclease [Parvularculaceae bacterium]
MTVSSMTGFARGDGAHGDVRWAWEMKSVNGRGLEVRFRLPPGFDAMEIDLRKALGEVFTRGSFNVALNLRGGAGETAFSVNAAALDAAVKAIEDVRLRIDCERPRPEGILALRGVVEQEQALADDDARASLVAALIISFREVASALDKARMAEGAALQKLIEDQLDQIAKLAADARNVAAASPQAIKDKITAQMKELLASDIADERLAQEAALLAVKADVREELDRLDAHVAAGRDLLKDKSAIGRRFDFLTQEFNREANTLCSKAQDMGLKRIGLDLKSVVDQMREQIQNIE